MMPAFPNLASLPMALPVEGAQGLGLRARPESLANARIGFRPGLWASRYRPFGDSIAVSAGTPLVISAG